MCVYSVQMYFWRKATHISSQQSTLSAPLSTAGINVPKAADVVTVPGSGVQGTVAGSAFAIGRRQWIKELVGATGLKIDLTWTSEDNGVGVDGQDVARTSDPSGTFQSSPAPPISNLYSPIAGCTEVWVASIAPHAATESRVLGCIFLKDTLRPSVPELVSALQARDCAVHLVTGDGRAAAEEAAREAGIRHVHYGLRPEDKAGFVQALRQRKGAAHARPPVIAMVGDGVNDAPALAAADVGFAMGGGTDAARGAASVVLANGQPSGVLAALDIARDTLATIRQNLGWALGYNLVAVPLAAGVVLPWTGAAIRPSLAAAFMAASSLAVVGNSLLLRRKVARSRA